MVNDAKMVQENFVEVEGNKIRYLETGRSKSTLILVHGLGASAERWINAIPYLEKDHHLIVPDLIGFGLSDKPVVDYTTDFFSDFLKKFLDSVGIKNPNIIGSSLGGQVTAEYASKNKNIKKLILVSPSGVMKKSTPALDAYIMAALYPNEANAKNAFEMMEGSGLEVDPSIVESFIERMKLPNAKMAFMSTILGLKNAELITNKLQFINVPTLIIWGSADPVIPINHADGFVSSIKDCRFYRMDNCGHTPYVQDPKGFLKNCA
ncbi:MAG: alpha/beta fold hydrolase [Nitrosopumilaceae archaeon]|nr:alpha/beta fold hydrolase [Nitrosopumilaceae archaeon]NIP09380.1 alpha/beta fold hydrolase [Nitrosopumilaceae archaeon]NIS94610.1 alpha/beta fold hydrolase [Nitrosopumilaceae archaeon]